MKHTYAISGMTCEGCKAKVQYLLRKINGVKDIYIDLEKGEADITMDHLIETDVLKAGLKDYPAYELIEKQKINHLSEEEKGFVQTYKPLLLIFAFITAITVLVQFTGGSFVFMHWMNHFMAGFFLVFSFFKFLNLKGFAESYAMYDIVAKRWSAYGYMYAFIELGLGLGYLVGGFPLLVNSVTFVVMSIGLTGVLQSVWSNSKIKCACLGDVFNLPMSTVTIIENGLMILMSLIAIIASLCR